MKDSRRGALIDEFFTLLSVCHTVIPEKEEGSSGKLLIPYVYDLFH
jgi:hypothetical protein